MIGSSGRFFYLILIQLIENEIITINIDLYFKNNLPIKKLMK